MLINATCENACGMFPSIRFAAGSYSSESSPTSLRSPEQPLEDLEGLVPPAHQDEVVGEPERSKQEGALAWREPVDAVVLASVAYRRTKPSTSSSRWIASTVPTIRGSSGGQEADQGSISRLASSWLGAVVLGEASSRSFEPLVAHVGVDLVASCASGRPVRPGRTPRPICTARSKATQAMTFEWVKWRRGPRTSQMPVVGLCQHLLEVLERASTRSQRAGGRVVVGGARPRAGQRRRAPRRRRRAGTARWRRCRCAPAPTPRSRAASPPRTR